MKSKRGDMFSRIRLRLTLTYSAMLMLFLLVFSMIVVAVLFFIISRDQIQELQTQTEQFVGAYRTHTDLPTGDSRLFAYTVNSAGQVELEHQIAPFLQEPILEEVQGWMPQNNEVKYISVHLQHDRDLNLLLAGRVLHEGDRITVVYTGYDVTYYWRTFYRLIEILIGLSIGFIIIAAVVGHLMSKRAMTPIRRSFIRQQEFIADASHELRTPLSVFQSSLDVIEMEESSTLSDYSRGVLKDMKDEVRSMTKLVSDLLTLARSDSNELQLQYERIDLVPIAQKVIRSLLPMANSNQIDLQIEIPPSLTLSGDKERLKQLLYILLDNAIKYTPNNGKVWLRASTEQIGQQVMCSIQVEDTGVGIPAEQQSQIFERFYRVHKNRSRQMGGTGLGLAIAKWIVDAHKGTINVSSHADSGSTFTVRLPVTVR